MEKVLTELEDKPSADAAHSFVEQKTYEPEPLQVDVFFHNEINSWVAVNMTTYEIQPLPAPKLAWAVSMEDEKATLVEVASRTQAGKLIDAFDHFSFQLWRRSSDD